MILESVYPKFTAFTAKMVALGLVLSSYTLISARGRFPTMKILQKYKTELKCSVNSLKWPIYEALIFWSFQEPPLPLWDESLIVSATISLILLRRRRSHSPGPHFSLSWAYSYAGLHARWGCALPSARQQQPLLSADLSFLQGGVHVSCTIKRCCPKILWHTFCTFLSKSKFVLSS